MPTGIYKHQPRSEETKEKLRQVNLGKHHSEETRAKISAVQKGKHHSPASEFKKGQVATNLGKKHTPESILKMSEAHKRMTDETRAKMRNAKVGGTIAEETKRRMSQAHRGKVRSAEHQRKLADAIRGEKHPNWKGGITPINKVIRTSMEYKAWRKAVFVRDNYTCKSCGVRGGVLHPHHIKPFALFPELRFDVDNGMTLCKPCHMQTDTYGGKFQRVHA